jgi:hypothetical protein
MSEKAKGVVTAVDEKISAKNKPYWFATIGGVKMLFFDARIKDCLNKEIEVEYDAKVDDKGTTFIASFPGTAKSGGGMKRGPSPEELKFKAIDAKLRTKTMIFSYAKDLVIANHAKDTDYTPAKTCEELDVYINHLLNKVANNIKELEER